MSDLWAIAWEFIVYRGGATPLEQWVLFPLLVLMGEACTIASHALYGRWFEKSGRPLLIFAWGALWLCSFLPGASFLPLPLDLLVEACALASLFGWTSPFWRAPFWFSDRWHILSALTHFPISIWITGVYVSVWLWIPLVYITKRIIWPTVKDWTGRDWDSAEDQWKAYRKAKKGA